MDRRQIQPPREQSSDIDRYLFEDPELDEPLEPVQPAKKPSKLQRLFSRKKEPALTEDNITPDRRYDSRNVTVPRRMSVTDSASGSANGRSALGSGSMPGLARAGTLVGDRSFPTYPRRSEDRHLHGADETFSRGPELPPANLYTGARGARDFSLGSMDAQRSWPSTNPNETRRQALASPQPSVASRPPRPHAMYDAYPQSRDMYSAPRGSRQTLPRPPIKAAPVVQVPPSERTESVRSSSEVAPYPTSAALVIPPPQMYPSRSTPPPIVSPRPSASSQSTRSNLFDREGSYTPPTSVSSRGHKPSAGVTSLGQNTAHFFGYEERAPASTVVRRPSNSSSFGTVLGSEDQSKAEVRFLEQPTSNPTFQVSDSAPISTPASIASDVAASPATLRAPLPVPTEIRFGGAGCETQAQMTVMTFGGLKTEGVHEPAFTKHQISDHLSWAQDILAKNAALRENISQCSRHRGLGNLGAQASSDWH